MVELLYQVKFRDRDEYIISTIRIRIQEEYQNAFKKDLESNIDAGYDPEEFEEFISRDDWFESVVDSLCEQYNGIWCYVWIDGVLEIR